MMDISHKESIPEKKRWLSLLNTSPFASPFQTLEYLNVIKELPDYDAEVFSLYEHEELKALMVITIMQDSGIKRKFSKRGIIFGGPVINENVTKDELAFFLKESCEKLKGQVIYLETRNLFDYSLYKESFNDAGWEYKPYLNYQLSLSDIERDKILSIFQYNRRREIKQSLARGANYFECNDEIEIEEIYNILNELYRSRVKVPLPTLDYFLTLFRKEIIKVFIVKHNNKIVGGSFCPVLPGKRIYTYYYCGIRNYHKKIFPTHLAVLAAIEYAVDHHIPIIDFMGAGKPEIEYGVRNYKSKFGGTLVEHGRFIKILDPLLYNIGKVGLKVLKILK